MNDQLNKRSLAPSTRPARPWALGLLLGVFWCPPTAEAQQPPAAPTATRVAPPPSSPHDALSDDPRLDVKVTMLHRSVPVQDALRELARQTKVGLAAGGNEAPAWQVALAVKDEPLRDVLRALAAVNNCHWKRAGATDGRDVLTLMDISDDPRYNDLLRPKTQAEADMHLGVEAFQREFSRLPPEAQKAFAPGGPGVGYDDLPPAMQKGVRQAFAAYLRTIETRHGDSLMTEDSVQSMSATLRARPMDGSTQYVVKLTGPWVPEGDGSSFQSGATLDARVPNDLSALDETVRPPDFVPWVSKQPQIIAARFDAARAKAIEGDPRLSRPVSIKTEDTRLGFPLAALADAAHVNIVAQVFPGTHTVSLASVPLKDALDQVTAKYQAVWAEAEDGTILVRYNEYPRPLDQKTAAK